MIARRAHIITPSLKLLAAVFCKMLRAAWMPKVTLVHWRHQIVTCSRLSVIFFSMQYVVWNEEASSSYSSPRMWPCYIPDNQAVKISQPLFDRNDCYPFWLSSSEQNLIPTLMFLKKASPFWPSPIISSAPNNPPGWRHVLQICQGQLCGDAFGDPQDHQRST